MSKFVTNFEVGADTCLVRDPQIMHYEGLVNAKFPPDGMTAAVGDGTQNDTNAIKELIAYCINNNFPLYFPAGVYLTSPITVSGNLSIVGSGAIIRLRPVMSGPLITLEGGLIAQGVTFDANLSGQTTIQNVIQCNNGEFRFSECTVTGGKSCIIGTIKNDCTLYNCVLSNFTECGINVEGTGRIISTSVVIPNIASGGALGFIKLDVSNSYVVAWESLAEVPVGVEITGNDNYVNVNFPNAETPVNDEGQNNNWLVVGKTEKQFVNGTAYHQYENLQEKVNGDFMQDVGNFDGNAAGHYSFAGADVILKPTNPISYKSPTYRSWKRSVPAKDYNGKQYNLLVENNESEPSFYVNPMDFGAVGDGETDDSAAFQTCFNLINSGAANGMIIPNKTFLLTQGFTFEEKTGIVIKGVSRYSIIKWEGTGAFLTFNGCSRCVLESFKVDGKQKASENQNGINIVEAFWTNNCMFTNLEFSNLYYGIYAQARLAGTGIINCLFENCFVGLFLPMNNDLFLVNCLFNNNTAVGLKVDGESTTSDGGVWCVNCMAYGNNTGVYIAGGDASNRHQNFAWIGGIIDSSTNWSFIMENAVSVFINTIIAWADKGLWINGNCDYITVKCDFHHVNNSIFHVIGTNEHIFADCSFCDCGAGNDDYAIDIANGTTRSTFNVLIDSDTLLGGVDLGGSSGNLVTGAIYTAMNQCVNYNNSTYSVMYSDGVIHSNRAITVDS